MSDRDFAIEFAAAAALVMLHLSRFAEELVLWSSPRFGFVTLADRFCTGSSIMPQKKNPDVPELVRGKSGRVVGHLMALITLMKAQPLAYNKDNQEDKEPLFDTVDTLDDTLAIMAELVATGHRRSTRSACARRRAKASRPRPTSPITWCAAACRSATRTKRSRARCGLPNRAAAASRTCRSAELRAFAPQSATTSRACSRSKARSRAAIIPAARRPAQVRAAIAAARASSPAVPLRTDPLDLRERPRWTARKLAFLGLGVMGYPMAGHLKRAGHDVVVYNRTPEKAEKWVAQHGGRARAHAGGRGGATPTS